ncbi:L-idonate 5-dehydrogenase [Bradyrhizobium genosp. L]|uniref:L-idonate 5-dehydrogenase n=1 Tax=Bradyrhizobium genosp. L TaxID=83637 RepID=UPI0018A248F1|nr:L-idonate 5-dehydrogenase [Bradyrhizobium genosp. L]QPF81950.1 L-idonate 5-dehydrogenase [Bradyrhizobium genosp. L]
MRAVVIHAPHDLRIDSFENPAPVPHQVRLKIAAGGICGSDLHYYHHGGFGVVRIREPMALGHEISGTIADVGSGVSHLRAGTRVAVNPSLPCGQCAYCREGMRNQCTDMRFLGSAMRFPHVQGGFREFITVDASQAIPIADRLSFAEAAMAEPFAVCLHAGHQAGSLLGKRVLVTGCGPIGALMVVVARYGGASEIVATDIAEPPLAMARRLGATHAINSATDGTALEPYKIGKGTFDVLFEASGNQAALRGALDLLRPGAVIVQVGLGGEVTLPINTVVAKELQLRGTFRFDPEFELALRLMGEGLVDLTPLVTASIPFEQAVDAFELASDRSRAMKVQLTF